MSPLLVVIRFRPGGNAPEDVLGAAGALLDLLASRPGWRSGRVGRAVDDPGQWVVATEWDSVGAYRRAMSALDVRTLAIPLLASAADEPTAFEVLLASGAGSEGLAAPSDRAPEGSR